VGWSVACAILNSSSIADKLLSISGVSQETTIVAYGSYPGTGAWIFWLLKLFGHQNLYVLNGGYQKWVAEGRPVTSALVPQPGNLVTFSQSGLDRIANFKEIFPL
jgi:3-mercaptopyruvate sulfurtransferase SseA